jgi:hypothetical protein
MNLDIMHLVNKVNAALDKIAEQIIGSVNSASHCKLVQDAFRPFGAKVHVALDDMISKDMIVVTGAYAPWRQRQNIEVYLTYRPGSKRILVTKNMWNQLRFDLSQTLQHELIHRMQCKHIKIPSEDWEDHACKVYSSNARLPAKRNAQKYYGDTEEIEAHAHCIMMELKHFAPRTDSIKLLQRGNQVPKKKSPTLYDYLETYDKDTSHPVIKRLLKKTVYWIEQEA